MKTKITFVLVILVITIVLTSTGSARAATWTQKADMPTARWSLSTSVVDGKIYAIGGIGGPNKVEEYDPATDTWTKKADMSTGRVFLASSAVNGKIYVIGGSTAWHGGTTLSIVEEYDPVTDTWMQKADMPTARDALSTSIVDGKIYAIGGWLNGLHISTVEEYDPVTDTWTKKADMPTAREFVATNVVNGKIYAFGGVPEITWPAFSIVEQYDPVTDTWTKKADMLTPRSFGLQTTVVDGKIYAFGGNSRRGGAPLSEVFRYDPITDIWTEEGDMPIQMLGMGVSTVGDKIYIIGGTSSSYPYSVHLSTVWEYDAGLGVPSPDFNGDGIINSADVSILIDHWHTDDTLYDIAPLPFGDNFVDVQDLIVLSEHLFEDVDDPTLIAHWALDEIEGNIAQDSAGDNFGSVIGGPVWKSSGGQVNGAIQLDGVDDYIIVSQILNPADGPFSILAWIKGGAAGHVIISELGGADWLSTDPLNGKLMTGLVSPPIGRFITKPMQSESIITDGQWHRIGFVWDGSYRYLYVDGAEVVRDVTPLSNLEDANNGLYLGAGSSLTPGTFFSGLIDDVRIYNRVVSP